MFTRLPKEDETLVLDLCDKLPCRAVVEKLALPRDQGGLSMVASESCAGAVTIEDFQEELSQYKLDLFNAHSVCRPERSQHIDFSRNTLFTLTLTPIFTLTSLSPRLYVNQSRKEKIQKTQ